MGPVLGFYSRSHRQQFIHLNGRLDDRRRAFTCGPIHPRPEPGRLTSIQLQGCYKQRKRRCRPLIGYALIIKSKESRFKGMAAISYCISGESGLQGHSA